MQTIEVGARRGVSIQRHEGDLGLFQRGASQALRGGRAWPFLLLFLLAAWPLAGCRKKASNEIDFGTMQNAVYSNAYFGLTLEFPKTWSPQDQEAQRQMASQGVKMMAGEDKNMSSLLKASELQTVNLFAVFQHQLGSPVDYNPSVLGVAEVVRHMPGIKRGSDYLFQTRKLLENGQIEIRFVGDPKPVPLGGVEFDVMETEIAFQRMVIRQKYYSTILKGYALCFIVSYITPAEDARATEILKTLAFRPTAP